MHRMWRWVLFKKDKGLDANTTFATATENQTLGFVYPSQPAGAQINYIKGYLDNMEQVLHGDNFSDPTAGYAQYMDVRSFIDVHLLVEMCKQIDGYRLRAATSTRTVEGSWSLVLSGTTIFLSAMQITTVVTIQKDGMLTLWVPTDTHGIKGYLPTQSL